MNNDGKDIIKEELKMLQSTAKKIETKEEKEFYSSGFPKDMNRKKFDLIINSRLKEVRHKRGYSLAQVVNMLKARDIITGRSTIQGYEADEGNSNHRYPSLNMLDHLCTLYNVNMEYIFGYSEEMEKPSQDLIIQIQQNEKVLWNGKEMTDGQKLLLVEKATEIMSV